MPLLNTPFVILPSLFSPLCQRRGELKRKGHYTPPLLNTPLGVLASLFSKEG